MTDKSSAERKVNPEYIQSARWVQHTKYRGLWELRAEDGVLLGWVNTRPQYCDRGHYQANLELSPGNPIDSADGLPCYYMRLDVAKQEVREKLLWRNCKIRAE